MDERLVEAAQALLTGYDTALSRQWREEDRRWRVDDLAWREREYKYAERQDAFLLLQQQWREQDLLQRHLDNARMLWGRAVEKNRRDVEEKSEQLKAVSALAALLAGFSLSAFLQFEFAGYDDSSGVMFPLFGVTMALTVGLETSCVIICTLMLASIFKTGQDYISTAEEAEFMDRCRQFAINFRFHSLYCREGEAPPAPQRSFAMHWVQRCEGSWRRAFLLFGAGIPTMFANLAVAAWIKFDTSLTASVLTTVVMAASLAFMAYFHRKWTTHILATEQLEQETPHVATMPTGLPFDWHLKPSTGHWLGARAGPQSSHNSRLADYLEAQRPHSSAGSVKVGP